MQIVSDHISIANWVKSCIGVDRNNVPAAVRSEFYATNAIAYGASPEFGSAPQWPDGVQHPTGAEEELLELSRDLTSQRISLTSKVQASYSLWQITTLISITIGMITTILISISSTSFGNGEETHQRLIRILAIVFPALGTATTACFAFYSPQTTWGQASRTLASDAQLHGEISLSVWQLACPKSDDKDDANNNALKQSLLDWRKRYTDSQTISTASGVQSTGGDQLSSNNSNDNSKTDSGSH